MFQRQVLVCKVWAIDRHGAGAIAFYKVATLAHELFDDSMKETSFIAYRLAVLSVVILVGVVGSG